MPKRKYTRRKSGFHGVYVRPKNKKTFQVQIKVDGKQKNLGSYVTAEQAAKVFDKEAMKLRRPLYKLNFPEKAPFDYTPIQQPLRSTNTVGYRGVTKSGKKFQAYIYIDGKQQALGTYHTAKEAAIVCDRAVLNANKCTSLLNFPDMVHNLDVEPKRKKYKRSSTGYRGVRKVPSGRFGTQCTINGKNTSIGTSDTAIQAALAYDQAAIKAGRKSHTLNFPDGLPIKEKETNSVKDGGYIVGRFLIQSYL